MPFPVEYKYIEFTEEQLKVTFPKKFKLKMMLNNGGELEYEAFHFELYPFFDQKNRKRISRTCNHIIPETRNMRKWANFPENAITIGSDGCGNQLVLIHEGNGILKETLFVWNHETGQLDFIAENIDEI
ncbi:MAG: SMI1/KNR4 family protein [Chitinophagales bacterium]